MSDSSSKQKDQIHVFYKANFEKPGEISKLNWDFDTRFLIGANN